MPRANGAPVRLRTYFSSRSRCHRRDWPTAISTTRGATSSSTASEIGAYPFTEFSVVASPLPTGFGMPTLTYLGADVLKLPFIRATSLGHEVLHNWWGNGVYVDYAHGQLVRGTDDLHGRLRVQGARVGRGRARDAAAAGCATSPPCRPATHQPLASFRSRTHGARPPSATASRRCCS